MITGFKKWFERFPKVLISFSGAIAISQSLKFRDFQLALDFAQKNDIILEPIYTRQLNK